MSRLEVRDLKASIGARPILHGIDFMLGAGQTLGLVGESGCGKSMLGLTLMGMLPPGGRATGSVRFEGRELVGLREAEYRSLRGGELAMVMQDPFTSLNPVMRIGDQLAETLALHQRTSRSERHHRMLEMLDHVGIPDPEASARKYPHQMSGGQRQRVVIAIAFACRPKVLIADEPTTALDVTLQAQILRLVKQLQAETGTAVLLISHNIGVIASVSDEIAVVYAGQFVEHGTAPDVLHRPRHPYTQALLAALPDATRNRLTALGGQPPSFDEIVAGCRFAPRCPHRFAACDSPPALEGNEHRTRCWLPHA